MNNLSPNLVKATICLLCILTVGIAGSPGAIAKKIRNRRYSFTVSIPDQLAELQDTLAESSLYYDTVADIILMISARKSDFMSVRDYMDCTMPELEQLLKNNYADSTLKLLSCDRSIYYPEKSTVLHLAVSVLPYGFDSHIIYFIHHRKRDIQFFFTYKKEKEQESLKYINAIMKTLKLKRL